VVGARAFEQPRVRNVLGEIATVADPDVRVVAVLDDQRRRVDERKHVAHVELEARAHLRERGAGARRKALLAPPPLLHAGLRGYRGCKQLGHRARPTAPPGFDQLEHGLPCLGRHPDRIVVVARESGEAVHQHERGDSLGVRRSEQQRHLGSVI